MRRWLWMVAALAVIGGGVAVYLLKPVTGVFAAQQIKPQARTLAEDRGIRCLTLDYDAMRGIDDSSGRLF